ncbi:hypothetical protein [Planktothrix paucivesiculata]|uniref:Chromosome segregation ATPase n=1 Tax=Planktothrix paucivesiculata PCC 9631 TaxID=671071 RepID=A0A7Z9DW91_9CYAN|nr:hypothetical protein [Planktothrix paucivesiculata]VXD14283.1 conserved hypothetical protein [Planktothrix paucivesiculata PCC 9631]
MSENQQEQSQSPSSNATASGSSPQVPIRSLVRKSRAEWLKELCTSLEAGNTPQPTADETPNSPALTETAGQMVLYQQPQASSSPQPKKRQPFVFPKTIPVNLLPLVLALLILVPGGIGVLAVSLLFRLPALPNCPKIFWPVASASLRLYCAESAANKQTVQDLLVAIDLVNSLSKDHPLRPEINRQIENWSMDILNLAEEMFQAGQLSEAIASAEKTPEHTPAAAEVSKRIDQWNSIWDKAEETYQKSEELMRQEKLNLAFKEATLLLNLGNNYWGTTKYQELTDLIAITREDSQKLAKARGLIAENSLDSWIEATKLIDQLSTESYLKEAGQKEITTVGNKMMNLAEETLKNGNWQEAINIANKIPGSANLQENVKDFTVLAKANVPALLDTVAGLKDAIVQAQKIGQDRPLYQKAQSYIRNWQGSIADVATLERARQLAQPGGVSDLRAAIAQVQTIPASNPRGTEAKTEMVSWIRRIEEIEDRPLLDTAEQLASFGDADSLKQAIAQAQKIGRGRTLYETAQNQIGQWTDRSQRLEYQPILDRAEQLATEGNYAEAIAQAQQINSGIVLYNTAKTKISQWKSQLRDAENLRNSETLASPGTPDSYVAAIRMANQVSNSSRLRSRVEQLIDQWGQNLLQLGLDQSTYDVPGAIGILKKIPPQSAAYSQAQAQIQDWQQWLNPPAPQPEYQPPAETYESPVEQAQPPVETYDQPSPEPPPIPEVSNQPPIELNKPLTTPATGI